MNKSNSIGAIDGTDLSEQTKFRLDELSKIENYFIGAPVGIASASFTLIFSLTTGIIKKLLNMTRKKEEKA